MGGLRVILTLVLAGALSACAGLSNIHWRFPGPSGNGRSQVFTTDAMQRHLVMSQGLDGRLRVCAEASPDAMSVFSTSIAAGGLFGPTQNQLDAAVAVGQTASTIERTQTINMLREWMYRTCELWLSGALSQEEFLTRSARDHRSMIAILSVEQLTGVVKPPATIITGPAAQAALAQSERTVELLASYRKERETAETAETVALKDFAEANIDYDDGKGGGPKKICEVARPTAADAAANYDKCKVADDKKKGAVSVADAARAREKQILDQLDKLTGGLAAGVSGGHNAAGGLDASHSGMSETALLAIGGTIERIALTAGVDEALMFCISYLRNGGDEGTRATCNTVVGEAARADRQLVAGEWQLSAEESERVGRLLGSEISFAERLVRTIRRTLPPQLVAKLKLFESRAEVSARADEACAKLTPAQCADFVEQRDLYALYFTTKSAALERALADWDKPAS